MIFVTPSLLQSLYFQNLQFVVSLSNVEISRAGFSSAEVRVLAV
jgi:hypothetical protein